MRQVKMDFSKSVDPVFGKSVASPHVIDWNGDGINDIVVAHPHFVGAVHTGDFHDKFFICEGKPSERNASLKWNFEPLVIEGVDALPPKEFTFGDFDNDGNVDLIYSEVKIGRKPNGLKKTSAAVYWMRNVTERGSPKFAEPVELFESPPEWRINSVSVRDIDGDKKTEVVCGAFKKANRNLDFPLNSEVWLMEIQN